MNKVAVIYWSGTGNTETMANIVAQGVKSTDVQVDLFTSEDFKQNMISNYTAFAFGCPSMGDEVLEEQEFEPMFESIKPMLKDKNIGLFGSYGWGDGEWMRNWEQDCIANGCKIICTPIIVSGSPNNETETALKQMGETLAKV